MRLPRDRFCGFCGTLHVDEGYPKTCRSCHETIWSNPIPVSVVLIPAYVKEKPFNRAWDNVILVKRLLAPVGGIALVGGFATTGETPQEAACRETREETGIDLSPAELTLMAIEPNPAKTFYLMFYRYQGCVNADEVLANFKPNDEVSELIIGDRHSKLCFPLHQKYLDAHFA